MTDIKHDWCDGCAPVLTLDDDNVVMIARFVHVDSCDAQCREREERTAHDAETQWRAAAKASDETPSQCMHLREATLPIHAATLVATMVPGTDAAMMVPHVRECEQILLCPYCAGQLMGSFMHLESHGHITPIEEKT